MPATSTADLLLADLERTSEDLMRAGEHDGPCTNGAQRALLPKVPPCKKHLDAYEQRKKNFKEALDQVKLLRDVFGTGQ